MKSTVKTLVATLGLTMLSTIFLHAGNGNGNPNPGIVPPHAKYKGKTAGEWTVAWWQWVRGTEGSVQMVDDSGDSAYVNNNGAEGVFFLAKSWAGVPQERHVTIPSGTPLLIPVMGLGSARPAGGFEGEGNTVDDLLNSLPPSGMLDLEIVIDGESVAALEDGNFHYLNYFGDDDERPTVMDFAGNLLETAGYEISLILTPLPPGDHVIEMRGKYAIDAEVVFETDVTYYITVNPGQK